MGFHGWMDLGDKDGKKLRLFSNKSFSSSIYHCIKGIRTMSLLSDMVINVSPITDICIMPDFKYALNSSQWHISKQTHVVHGVVLKIAF